MAEFSVQHQCNCGAVLLIETTEHQVYTAEKIIERWEVAHADCIGNVTADGVPWDENEPANETSWGSEKSTRNAPLVSDAGPA
jgi:hypothetical protein